MHGLLYRVLLCYWYITNLFCVSYNLFLLVESVLQQLSVFNASEDDGEMKLCAACCFLFLCVLFVL